jgi:hypothetical protein
MTSRRFVTRSTRKQSQGGHRNLGLSRPIRSAQSPSNDTNTRSVTTNHAIGSGEQRLDAVANPLPWRIRSVGRWTGWSRTRRRTHAHVTFIRLRGRGSSPRRFHEDEAVSLPEDGTLGALRPPSGGTGIATRSGTSTDQSTEDPPQRRRSTLTLLRVLPMIDPVSALVEAPAKDLFVLSIANDPRSVARFGERELLHVEPLISSPRSCCRVVGPGGGLAIAVPVGKRRHSSERPSSTQPRRRRWR